LVKIDKREEHNPLTSSVALITFFLTEKTPAKGKEPGQLSAGRLITLANQLAKTFFGLVIKSCPGSTLVGRGLTAQQPTDQMELPAVSRAVAAHQQMKTDSHSFTGSEFMVHGLRNQPGNLTAIEHPYFHFRLLGRRLVNSMNSGFWLPLTWESICTS
jgi:hypothetical protein